MWLRKLGVNISCTGDVGIYCNCVVLWSSCMLPSLHLGEINSGIHVYQFEPLHFLFSAVFVVSDLNKNFGGSTDLTEKGNDRRICIPLFISLWLVWASFQTDLAYWADPDSYKLKFEGKNFTSRRRLHWARVVQNPEIVVFEGHRGS